MKRCNWLIVLGVTLVSVSAQADTLYLKDGSVIEGTIVRSLGKTFSIKLDSSGMYQLPQETVDKVEIDTVDGEAVVGSLVGWTEGVYLLLVMGQGLVEVRNGVVRKVVDDNQTVDTETQPAQGDVGGGTNPVPATRVPTEEHQSGKLKPTM